MAERITTKYPQVKVLVGDVQERIPVPEGYFHRVVAVHVLEHLPDLPAALREIQRVMHPQGRFSIVLPCEGGVGYDLARRVSTKRLFEKRYHSSYDWFIKAEHVNDYQEIIDELEKVFSIQQTRYWPLRVPNVHANLVVGVTCTMRNNSTTS